MTHLDNAPPAASDPSAEPGPAGGPSRFGWDALWIAALWLAAALYFQAAIFGGQTLYFRDTVDIYYPQALFTASALREGRLPLWEPKIGLGYPYQADPHSMVFYPLTVLLLLFPFPSAYNLFTLVHVPLAGTFLFLLLRRWGLSRPSAGLGAATLMFCGFTIGCTCLTTLLRGLTWAPLAMLAFDRFLSGGGLRALAQTALVLAIQGSGTDPQYVFFTAIALALLPAMRPAPGYLPARRVWLGWAGAGALAACILAYQYLPLAELIQVSNRVRGLEAQEQAGFAVHPANLYNLFLPVSFPDPATGEYLASFRGGQMPLYPDLYWGLPVLALALASLGWFANSGHTPKPNWPPANWVSACVPNSDPLQLGLARPESGQDGQGRPPYSPGENAGLGRLAVTACLLAVVCLALSLGDFTPLHGLLTKLVPPLTYFRYPSKYLLLTALGVALAAAAGFEGLRRQAGACQRAYERSLELLGGLTLVGLGLLLATGTRLPEAFLADGIWQAIPPSLGDLHGLMQRSWLSNGAFAVGLLAAARVLLALASRGKLQRGHALAAIAILTAGDLTLGTHRSFPTVQNEFLTAVPRAVDWVGKAGPGEPPPRYASLVLKNFEFDAQRTVLWQFLFERELLHHFWGSLHGFDPALAYMSVQLASNVRMQSLFGGQPRALRNRLFGAIGVTAVVRPMTPVQAPDERLLGSYGPLAVQAIDGAVPRAFVAGRAVPVSSGEPLPTHEALLGLPSEAPYEGDGAGASWGPAEVKACRLSAYESDSLAVDFELQGRGLLVVLDQFHPGWEARVDGQPRPIRRVCGLFRGVEVRSGERRLEMVYRPASFRTGSALSLAALAFAALLLAVPWLERRRAASVSPCP
jgi:hypothetical protein